MSGGGCVGEKLIARSSGIDGVIPALKGCLMVGKTPPLPSGTPDISLAGEKGMNVAYASTGVLCPFGEGIIIIIVV